MKQIIACLLPFAMFTMDPAAPCAAEDVSAVGADAAVRLEDAFRQDPKTRPAGWTVLTAGDLGLILDRSGDGLRLQSLFDLGKHQQLLAQKPLPLFTLTLRHAQSKQDMRLQADAGWKDVQVACADPTQGGQIRWQHPKDAALGNLSVVAAFSLDPSSHAIRWKLNVENVDKQWIVRRVIFPQLALRTLGSEFTVLYPHGPGRILQGAALDKLAYKGKYPSGWTAVMQFMAAYDPEHGTGFYCGMHDSQGTTKELQAEGRPAEKAVAISFDSPAENMDTGGNGFTLGGEANWQIFRGDWFDAAMIYRAWARHNAVWFPQLTTEGRADTPLWFREMPLWVQTLGPSTQAVPTRGTADQVVPCIKEFARTMGVPVGFHWYQWHQIPFDNDYPHYFPTKDGFLEGVRKLQASGVRVMPYINGRLWDTRDRGLDDFEFTRRALPSATKKESGKPHTETYGSKEDDGSDVRLAAMCPTTSLWQETVSQTALRLMNEYEVAGVYIDQIGAAPPVLCFDRKHGHPVGGGHWWTESYLHMLDKIRRAMPADRILTTESNGETFIKGFDGYLTWHWCFDDQVPAFPAVYGGTIQMFGRSFGGGDSKDLALRMKTGQQLVYGEQIGWFEPDVIREKENLDFLRQVVGLRWQLRRSFYAGEMGRPPRFQESIPKVRADWKWDKSGWVTTDAVLTGAWLLPQEHRCAMIFVNVSDKAVTARLKLDTRAYGMQGEQVQVVVTGPSGSKERFNSPRLLDREVTVPARSAFAWEFSAP